MTALTLADLTHARLRFGTFSQAGEHADALSLPAVDPKPQSRSSSLFPSLGTHLFLDRPVKKVLMAPHARRIASVVATKPAEKDRVVTKTHWPVLWGPGLDDHGGAKTS